MASTSAKNSTKSKKTPARSSAQRSVPDAAQALIPIAKPSFKNDSEALKCSLILLQHFCQAMISPPQLRMIFSDAKSDARKAGIEATDEIFEQLGTVILRERYKNPINAALDRIGFW